MNAQQIRNARQLLGLGQFEFAMIIGCQRYRLSLLENGHIEIKPAEVESIRRALEKAASTAETDAAIYRRSVQKALDEICKTNRAV